MKTPPKNSKSIKIEYDGKNIELPVLEGSEKEKAIDISTLRAKTELVTYDNGYANTSSCQSAITFLDGERGILHYRGFPIEQLAEHATFLEVAFLLIHGELPTQQELKYFENSVVEQMKVPSSVKKIFEGFPKKTHPMAMLSAATVALSGVYPEELDPADEKAREKTVFRLLGHFPVLTAWAYRQFEGKKLIDPDPKLDYCTNFLNMMFGGDGKKTQYPKEVIEALNLLLILHADHEQNCSTSTVRLVGSSDANLYASISSGICALWGPLHGGANQAVMEMLEKIHKNGGDVKKYVGLAKDKNSDFKLMGFGHRVYKNFDPRASIIKKACDLVLSKMGIKNPLLDIARKLEEAALNDSYFKERKLYPNVDFYSGIIYSALNIPTEMFTPMFALGRLPGWVAHWKELRENDKGRIGRPRQIYTGSTKREFVPVKNRNFVKKAA